MSNFSANAMSRADMKKVNGGNCTDIYYNCRGGCPNSGQDGWLCHLECYGNFNHCNEE